MSNRELPMMPWYPDQFAASTADWSFTERAVYRALLDLQWQNGFISASLPRLSRALHVRLSTLTASWQTVGHKFATVEGGLQNHRLEEHRLAALELHRKKVAAARVRWDSAHAEHMQTHVQSTSAADAGHMPLSPSPSLKIITPNPTPTRKRAANGKSAAARPTVGGTGAIREDDPEVQRKRREAESLAAQHAKPRDDDMPF